MRGDNMKLLDTFSTPDFKERFTALQTQWSRMTRTQLKIRKDLRELMQISENMIARCTDTAFDTGLFIEIKSRWMKDNIEKKRFFISSAVPLGLRDDNDTITRNHMNKAEFFEFIKKYSDSEIIAVIPSKGQGVYKMKFTRILNHVRPIVDAFGREPAVKIDMYEEPIIYETLANVPELGHMDVRCWHDTNDHKIELVEGDNEGYVGVRINMESFTLTQTDDSKCEKSLCWRSLQEIMMYESNPEFFMKHLIAFNDSLDRLSKIIDTELEGIKTDLSVWITAEAI